MKKWKLAIGIAIAVLWYDSSTRIVYFWNGELSNMASTAPSPYYAPNGRPYRYDPTTNTFEEIDD